MITNSNDNAFYRFRHEQGPDGEVVPRFTDRLVVDRALRGRLGPGGLIAFRLVNLFVF